MFMALRSPDSTFSLGNPVLDSHICTYTPDSQHFGMGGPWQNLLKSKLLWVQWHHQEQQVGPGNGCCEHIPMVCRGDSEHGCFEKAGIRSNAQFPWTFIDF